MTHLIIISHSLKELFNKKMSTFTLGNLSESMIQLFPSKSKETYYNLQKRR